MKRSLDQITFRQLRALDAVAREKAINRAADILHLTPPAVHNQLKTLEDLMECSLVDRSGPEFHLTEAGQALLSAYREGNAAMQRACHHIEALSKGLAGSVVLGVVSTAKYFAPAIVGRLRQDLPKVRVKLEIGNRQETLAALEARRYDLCIMGRPPRIPPVNAEALGAHPHVIVAAPDHPLAGRDYVSVEDLLEEEFVMREPGSGTRVLATRYLDELGEGREVEFLEMTSNETIKQAVISGLGIAMLSGHTCVEELRSGRLVALACPGMPVQRQWFLVERQDQELSNAAQVVRAWMLENRETLLPHLDMP
ncbi:MAG: LysR family transcriptional regulator [Mangrovicoccus sp.]